MDVTQLASRLSRADFAPGETLNLILIKVTSLHKYTQSLGSGNNILPMKKKKNCLKRISRNECEKEGRQGRLEASTISVIYLAGKKLFLSCEGKGKKALLWPSSFASNSDLCILCNQSCLKNKTELMLNKFIGVMFDIFLTVFAKTFPPAFRLGSGAARIQGALRQGWVKRMWPSPWDTCWWLSGGQLSCQKKGSEEGVLYGHLHLVRLGHLSAK